MPSYRESLIAHATFYVFKFGLSVIPMSGKKPTTPWKHLQERHPTLNEILSWRMDGLAMITGKVSGICVIDCDTRENARWWNATRPQTHTIVRTKRGAHFYYRCPKNTIIRNTSHVAVEGVSRYDVRGEGGYVLIPPTTNYTWVKGKHLVNPLMLPDFDPIWRPNNESTPNEKSIKDAVAYINKIYAISGQGGHNDTFRAVQRLKDAGLSEGEALLAMQTWNNSNAAPPWSDKDILHKIRSAYK